MAESLITLLCAAYTIEQRSLEVIGKYLEAADNPDARIRIRAHLVETQWQVKLLRACLEFQGIDRVDLDKRAYKLAVRIGKTGLLAVKKFEIRLYKKVLAVARKQHAPEVLQACREILEQERAMAEWIEDNHSKMSPSFWQRESVLSAA